jgi:hypothetical protein
VDGQVNFPGQQGFFNFLDEKALAPHLSQGDILELVPGGFNNNHLDSYIGMPGLNLSLHPVGLGQGQVAAPGADADGPRQLPS